MTNNILIDEFDFILKLLNNEFSHQFTGSIKDSFLSLNNVSDVDSYFFKETKGLFKKYGLEKGDLFIGPNIGGLKMTLCSLKKNLSRLVITDIKEHFKQQFICRRKLRFLGIDLDDCIYDNTPVKNALIEKIRQVSGINDKSETVDLMYNVCKDACKEESEKEALISKLLVDEGIAKEKEKKKAARKVLKEYCNFMTFKDKSVFNYYEPYDWINETLKSIMDKKEYIVGIVTNGSSFVQRKKLQTLGLKEGCHFDFVLVSEDIKSSKPSKLIYNKAIEMAINCVTPNRQFSKNEDKILPVQCLIIEDRVKNVSGAEEWLKVQFLKGRHSNKLPANPAEIPKYGVSSFEILTIILEIENDEEFQKLLAYFFIFKSLILMHIPTN